jgi:nucleoside-diphosphate-sugar epimerase
MKLAAEWLGHNYESEYGVEWVVTRFAGVFGPWHGAPSGGPSQMIQQLLESACAGRPYRVSTRDLDRGVAYVYAADAAQGAIRAAFAPEPASRVYNVAMAERHSIREIAGLIEWLTGRPVDLDVYDGGAQMGYERASCALDTSRARAEIGFENEYPMEVAIRDYLDWLSARTSG